MLLAACSSGPVRDATPATVETPPAVGSTPPPLATATRPPVADLPVGTPGPIDEDVAASDLDPAALVPAGMRPEGSWVIADPAAVVVAYASPSEDPFLADRGLIAWRHFEEAPAWRPVYGGAVAGEEGVLGIGVAAIDVTGDGDQDALVQAATGGSGSCATWLVIDIARGARVFERPLCDADIAPWSDPVGLRLEEAIYRVGDPHCCPSAFRTSVLSYGGDGEWQVVSTETRPAA